MNCFIFVVALIVFSLDQLSKIIIVTLIKENTTLNIISNVLSLTPHNNYGAAWGILSGRLVVLVTATLIGFVIIYRFMRTFKLNKRNMLSFGLLIGGIFGNLLDRLFFGYVRDFIDVNIINYNFPIFNIADMSIVIAVILLIIAIFKGEDKKC